MGPHLTLTIIGGYGSRLARSLSSGARSRDPVAWPGRRMGCRYATRTSAPHRQRNHIISMPDGALQHGVFEFVFEPSGGTDAALGGEGAAEHRASIRQFATVETASDQAVDRQHGVERAL